MHIGLIGGIGPAATVAYYLRLIDSFKGAALPLDLTLAHADIATLAGNATADRKQDQAEVFAHHLRQLEGGGCDVAMITSLTGHFCFAETKRLSPLTLIDGLEVIDRACRERNIARLGLLGSPPVLKTRLYGSLRSCEAIVPDENPQEVGDAYMAMANNGACSESQRKLFFDAGAAMVREQGAEAILLAGTDLGLAFDGQDPGFPVIDALDLHVEALVSLASEQPAS